MTISSSTNKKPYLGDGATISFSTAFKFFDNSHVTATHVDAPGVETAWVEGTHYSLTGAGDDTGGTLTVLTTPTDYTPASGATLVITLTPPNTQGTSLPAGGTIKPSAIERMVDLTVQQILGLRENIDRQLSAPISETSIPELPTAVARASKFLAFDANGDPVASAGSVDGLTVSPFAQTLIADVDAGNARATLDAQQADANTARTNTDQNWAGSQRSPFVTDNDGSFDMDAGQNFKCTPAANLTLAFANLADGQSGFVRLVNTGGYTIGYNAAFEFSGTAPSLGTGTHLLGYVCDGTNVTVTYAQLIA